MSKALAKRNHAELIRSMGLNKLETTFSFIQPPDDEIRGLNYYRDELEVQLKRFDAFKDKVNDIIEKGKQQEYVLEFRKMLSGRCIISSSTITIIHCTNKIKRNECGFHEQCETRKTILDLIKI